MLEQRIQQHFIDSADLKYQAAQVLSQPIAAAVQAVLACVTSGGKLLACGSGPSAAQARQFAALCVAGFERERPELAALARIEAGSCDPLDFDRVGERWWPIGGGVYIIQAIKRVHSMRLIMPKWDRRAAGRALAPLIQKAGGPPKGCSQKSTDERNSGRD